MPIVKLDATTWVNLNLIVEFADDPEKQELFLASASTFSVGRNIQPYVVTAQGAVRDRILAWLATQDTGIALVE